jgi:hypothetical protein
MKNVTTVFNYVPKVKAAVTGEALAKALLAGGFVVETQAKINVNNTFSSKSTGGAGLGGSIHTELVEQTSTSALVHVGPSKVYGRIQELGGIIKPVFAKMLSWVNDSGERVFANMVHIPARPYLRPAIDEHKDEVQQAISIQVEKSVKAAL